MTNITIPLNLEKCPICYNSINEPILYSCGEHFFCFNCICKHRKKNCPMCRGGDGSVIIIPGISEHKNKIRINNAFTIDNLKGRNCEYALRCNPNARKKTKQHKLWCFLLKYETEYNHINF